MAKILCVCGDEDMQHIDGEAQCCIPECGCKEFEESEKSIKANREFSPEQERIIESLISQE
jgi:hypothetical protein